VLGWYKGFRKSATGGSGWMSWRGARGFRMSWRGATSGFSRGAQGFKWPEPREPPTCFSLPMSVRL
jgi:hypothetical protein